MKTLASFVLALPVIIAALVFAIPVSCLPSGAPTPQTAADLAAAETDLKAAIPVACVIAEAIDPALMTVVCAVADAADNLITPPSVVVTSSPAQAAALVVAHPATSGVTAKLKTASLAKVGAHK